MNHDATPTYGLWSLVVINSLVFIIFAFAFTKPQTTRDWRSFGAFSAFLLALFSEMYGLPLTMALGEEQEAQTRFGAEYDRYAARTPRFLPRLATKVHEA